jgi:hypothetical protein
MSEWRAFKGIGNEVKFLAEKRENIRLTIGIPGGWVKLELKARVRIS